MYVIIAHVGNPLSTWVWLHGSGVSESGKIHLHFLRDRLGALSTRLALHGLRGHILPQKPRCVYSHPVASVQMTLQDLWRIGERLIEIKKTQDDHVITCVSELEGAGDASALEKYYLRTCLLSAQRTFTPVFHSNVQIICTVCYEQLLLSIQTTLSDDVTVLYGWGEWRVLVNSEEISRRGWWDDKLSQASETAHYWTSSKCPVRQIVSQKLTWQHCPPKNS